MPLPAMRWKKYRYTMNVKAENQKWLPAVLRRKRLAEPASVRFLSAGD
jgi:hypothetical protein